MRKKHRHKKVQHRKHRSLSDSEHRHRRSKRRHSPSSSSSEASSEIGSDSDASTDEDSVSSTHSSSEQEYSSRKLPKHSNPGARHRKKLRMAKQKHHHKKNRKHRHHRSLSDSEHRHRKSSSGTGDPRKRKRRRSPSSNSSEASFETGSDSDASSATSMVSSIGSSSEQCCSRTFSKPSAKLRRKKYSRKKSKAFAKGRKLREVFREHFAELMLQISCPEQLADDLYSHSLICKVTREKIIMFPNSRQQKTLDLLWALDRRIKADPEKLFVFIRVIRIQGDPSLQEVAAHLAGRSTLYSLFIIIRLIAARIECSMYWSATTLSFNPISVDGVTNAETPQHIKQPDSKSASSKCTADAETGTRSGVQDGDSSYQQSHSTEDAAGTNYAPITHQPPSFSSAIARYQHYLKSLYKAKPTPVDDKLFIGPCAQYINLAIIKKEQLIQEEADEFTRATLHGGVDQILCRKEQVHFEDIFSSESTSPLKCILVEGPPGIGKSTFAWELCRQWDELEAMQQYSLVVLLKLRERNVQNCKSVSELLNHPTDPMLGQAVVHEILEGEGVLLILDGFDEFPSALLKEDNCLIRQLISGSCLPKATVVVTSRPSARISFQLCQPQVSKHIEIIGFTEEDRVKYAESVFNSQPDMLVHFLKYIFSNPTIKTMMYIPLVCAIVAQMYKECGGARKLIPTTMTQLYTALCRSLLRRYLVENSLLSSDERMSTEFEDLPQDVYGCFCTLSKIAYDGILKETLVFYKYELPEKFEHMGFMSECRELCVDRGTESSYNFLHLSLQEYLAAWHISQLPSTEQREYFERELCIPSRPLTLLNSQKKFAVVTLFLAGITGLRNDFWQSLCLVTVSPDICRCIFEAQNSKFCQQHLCSVAQQHSQVFTTRSDHEYARSLSGLDFYALGYCIAHSTGSWCVFAEFKQNPWGGFVRVDALEMLVNGMRHESKHQLPTGLITELKFCNIDLSIGIAWLKELPRPVLNKLSVLTIRQCCLSPKSFEIFAQAIAMMPNLHSVDVSNFHWPSECVPETFIKSLSSLKQLKCLRVDDTNIGSHDALKGFANLIKTSATLQSLHVGNSFGSLFPVPVLKEVIPSALASTSLKEFVLHNITMADMIQLSLLLPTNSSITCLTLHGDHVRYNDGLAYLSQALYTNTSLTSIMQCGSRFSRGSSGYSRFSREETITLLNDALQQNLNLRDLKLERSCDIPYDLCLPRRYPLQQLAHQLRRGPSGPQLQLKRAQSLPCLSKYTLSPLEFPLIRENAKLSPPWFSIYRHSSLPRMLQRAQLSRYRSAPDLSLIECISSLHPSLVESLEIQKFYYRDHFVAQSTLEFIERYI